MKRLIRLVLVLTACLVLSPACNSFIGPVNDDIPEGMIFYTNVQGLTFFFVDGDGNDLVDYDDKTTWPLASPDKMEPASRQMAVERVEMTAREDGKVFYIYNDNCNAIAKDLDTRHWGFTTYLWGRTLEPEFTTYIYAGGGLDSLRVGFDYLRAGETGGTGWGVQVNSVRYNGVEVFLGNENGKVFIQKPSQEQTIVKVGRL